MALILRTLAIIVLAVVLGAASVYFSFFPGRQLSDAFTALQALQTQSAQQQSPFNAGAVYEAAEGKRGVTRLVADAVQDGYTLLAMGHGKQVLLLDMHGEPVHQWSVDYMSIWDGSGNVQSPVPGRFIFIRKAALEPDGSLLVIFSAWSTTPYGYGIAKLDRDSNVLWADFRHIHHSFDQAEDGRIYALDQSIAVSDGTRFRSITGPYLDDGIAIYSRDGEFIKRFSLLSVLHDSPYTDVVPFLAAKNSGDGLGDLLHANDVDVLSGALAEKFPFASAGDLLISLRELDSIAIVDPATEQVKWFQNGYWRRQHDADFLANGNMLVFDNYALRRSPNGRRASRVVEFDPETMQIVWEYRAAGEESFFTPARGSQQRLPNGNTLITESEKSRVFEVTPAGEIVWEYFNHVRVGDDHNLVPGIFWATRYTVDELGFL